MSSLDDYFTLCGDEDTNVGLICRFCDRGGLPIVFYTTNEKDRTYAENEDVVRVSSIQGLIDQSSLHVLEHL